uniref:5'-3' exonuclease PLD3 n=4 Tax=Nothobranchius TaxID=28779 RepID=A0A1A8R275_9TELE
MKTDISYNPLADAERRRPPPHRGAQLYARCLIPVASVACLLLVAMVIYNFLTPEAFSHHHHEEASAEGSVRREKSCSDPCKVVLVESIPEGLEFNSSTTHPSIYQAWINLMKEARSSVDIASFYWTLTNKDTNTSEPTASQGEDVLKRLAELSRALKVRVAVNAPEKQPQDDLQLLRSSGVTFISVCRFQAESRFSHTCTSERRSVLAVQLSVWDYREGCGSCIYNDEDERLHRCRLDPTGSSRSDRLRDRAAFPEALHLIYTRGAMKLKLQCPGDLCVSGADVRTVDMKKLTSGVLHTKFWLVDRKHLYIGSANMDWRSLTQVKELGAVVYNCSCLAADLEKIFEAYWYVGGAQSIPSPWPSRFSTAFNNETPLQLPLNNTPASVYLSSSPPSFCASGRTSDLQSILSVIADADRFVYIAVMNYQPTMEFSHPKRYWADIDTQLRRVAYERRVKVRLLISCWDHSQPLMFSFLRSLASVYEPKSKLDVQVRLFVVQSNPRQKQIPFARVNHNKYMVTDKVAYIGTSNWSGDYFVNTAGSALVVNQTESGSSEPTVQSQLKAVFERDWFSNHSTPLSLKALEDFC